MDIIFICFLFAFVSIIIYRFCKHWRNFKNLFFLFLPSKKITKLSTKDAIERRLQNEDFRKQFTHNEEYKKNVIAETEDDFYSRVVKLRNSIKQGLITVILVAIAAIFTAILCREFIELSQSLILLIQSISAMMILWALISKLGWPIQVYKGKTIPEQMDNFWFILLNITGSYFLFSTYFYSFFMKERVGLATIHNSSFLGSIFDKIAIFETGEWLTIIAILMAPLIAVRVEKIIEHGRVKKERQMQVFRVLMATRANPISHPHVEHLNTIPIEFYKKAAVIDAWKKYMDHLYSYPKNRKDSKYEEKMKEAAKRTNNLLGNLLYEMARCLKYNFDKNDIKKYVYNPQGHSIVEMEQALLRKKFLDVLSHNGTLPVYVTHNQERKKQQDNHKNI